MTTLKRICGSFIAAQRLDHASCGFTFAKQIQHTFYAAQACSSFRAEQGCGKSANNCGIAACFTTFHAARVSVRALRVI